MQYRKLRSTWHGLRPRVRVVKIRRRSETELWRAKSSSLYNSRTYWEVFFRSSVGPCPDVARLTIFALKKALVKRSPPSLRSGASAGAVVLPVQLSNLLGGLLSKQCRALPRRSPPNNICFEESPCKAKPAVAPKRSYGGRSRGDRIRTYDLHVPNVARYRAALRPEIFSRSNKLYRKAKISNQHHFPSDQLIP